MIRRAVKLTVYLDINEPNISCYAISEYSQTEQERELIDRVVSRTLTAAREIYLNGEAAK